MDATIDTAATMRIIEDHRVACVRARPSWTAIAAMMLSVMLPVCGWMISLSNRVAVIEAKTDSLATAAQMAEVKQKIDDWIATSIRERVDDSVLKARDAK